MSLETHILPTPFALIDAWGSILDLISKPSSTTAKIKNQDSTPSFFTRALNFLFGKSNKKVPPLDPFRITVEDRSTIKTPVGQRVLAQIEREEIPPNKVISYDLNQDNDTSPWEQNIEGSPYECFTGGPDYTSEFYENLDIVLVHTPGMISDESRKDLVNKYI